MEVVVSAKHLSISKLSVGKRKLRSKVKSLQVSRLRRKTTTPQMRRVKIRKIRMNPKSLSTKELLGVLRKIDY